MDLVYLFEQLQNYIATFTMDQLSQLSMTSIGLLAVAAGTFLMIIKALRKVAFLIAIFGVLSAAGGSVDVETVTEAVEQTTQEVTDAVGM